MSFSAAERTREIGVRAALGADRREIMVLRNVAAVAGAGAVVGVVFALWLTRVLQGLLSDAATTDPVTYALVIMVIGASHSARPLYLPCGRRAWIR